MNSYEVVKTIKQSLDSAVKENDSLLHGVSIETDPYSQLEDSLPFILIEDSSTELITNGQGYVLEYLHTIELTCAVKTGKDNRECYRTKLSSLAENTLMALAKISDFRFRTIPKEMIAGEVLIGSLKCCAVKITIEVKTLFIDD